WLDRQWCAVPVWGCVLIGGQSRRMGRPKHLLRQEGRTWLEGTVAKLREKVDRVVISGRGEIPASLADVPCIADAPGVAGPLAGVLSVMRWQPHVSWLVTACDQPCLQPGALDWLLATRRPGVWAILPDLRGAGRPEPLLAYYDFRCRDYLEDIAVSGSFRLGNLAGRSAVLSPRPPAHLHQSWLNINMPAEIPSPGPLC
ncbi:MAG TPA: molybdenum cofactor guanylyltransferase, partial [Desulfobacteraceae bacterium]|nr:molybdenum cofactor guanylyltransferase [Desulfobacteraceae bacterium]